MTEAANPDEVDAVLEPDIIPAGTIFLDPDGNPIDIPDVEGR
jgi:hypothetical protein